ncbi:hypothetical protein Bca52824_007527 [Brassica carinata]|uniref:MIF4G domain-containing protein n=1 Tax=Brassica carinata TaxID=52824 RepID=A0A8X7W828_BRACI|nr:hypothetical protein Bca52824_007527 [Brassica carinata]
MHQAQGHSYATPMGAQIHSQLGCVGVGESLEEQAKQRKFKVILNKLTPQNFKKLLEQVNIDNAVTLIGVVSQIFDKALKEPTFVEMYADLCFHLSGTLPDFNWNGEEITFKRLLINKCQEEFERVEKEEEEASRVSEEGQTEKKGKRKDSMFGGECYVILDLLVSYTRKG